MSLFSRVLKFSSSSTKNIWKKSSCLSACSFSLNTIPLQAPRVQDPAPHFEGTAVVNQDFKQIKLSDYKGKYLVFYFYPLDFTFVCPTEIIAFSENYEEFKKIDTEIVACSTDSHFSHLAWTNTPRKSGGIGEIKYPLLSDFTKVIAKEYNVLIESSGVPLRGLFIIDGKGIIRHMSVNDLPVGRSVEEILRLVKAFQFNDKHGEGIQISEEKKPLLSKPEPEISSPSKKKFKDFFKQTIVRPKVCPANWQPNTATIKPNPKDSKEYFDKGRKSIDPINSNVLLGRYTKENDFIRLL